MNKQTSGFRAPMVGGSSLLVIFAVLCLTMFALLGLSTAQANKRLADASIKAVADYYAADCEAEKILAQIRSGRQVEGVGAEDAVFRYKCPISDTQMLLVEARVNSANEWQILRWQSVSAVDKTADELLKVWDGESFDDHE